LETTSHSFDQAWERFQSFDTLRLATESSDWSRGRAQFLAFLVRIEDSTAREHLSRISERLAGIPGVNCFPEWYWHSTVKGAGFQVIRRHHEDDVLRQDAWRIGEQAQSILSREEAFEAQLGLPNAFPDAAFIEVWDQGRLRQFNERLMAGIPELHRYPNDGDAFLPHVSVAQFSSSEGLSELKAALAALRSEGPGPSFPVRRVEFVKAWLIEDVAEFDVLATFALKPPR
jgi:hypothetical protein